MTILEKRLHKLQRHIHHVQENANLLAENLIEIGEFDLAKQLIANSMSHDSSKLTNNIEWEYLHPEVKLATPELFYQAHLHHITHNAHHPEFWSGGIKEMTPAYLAEFVCDVKARSEEFGTCTMEWLVISATKKFGFTTQDIVFANIQRYLEMVCDKVFV